MYKKQLKIKICMPKFWISKNKTLKMVIKMTGFLMFPDSGCTTYLDFGYPSILFCYRWKKRSPCWLNSRSSWPRRRWTRWRPSSTTGFSFRARPWTSRSCFWLFKNTSRKSWLQIWTSSRRTVAALSLSTMTMDPCNRVLLQEKLLTDCRCSRDPIYNIPLEYS